MAKHLVTKTFRDKETSQLVVTGSFFETDDKKRLDDMIKKGFLKSEEKPAPVKKESTETEKITTKPTEGKKKPARKKSGE